MRFTREAAAARGSLPELSTFARLVVLVVVAAGGVAASQLPEFAQQYRQRLGGALDELQRVVEDFDADAARNHLTRQQALAAYGTAGEAFLHDRGISMSASIGRYDWLREQRARLDATPPLLWPLVVASGPDEVVVEGAWRDFEPAVPVTPAGLLWGGLGLLGGGSIVLLARWLGRAASRRRGPAGSAAR
jgi:hypothetical protein